MSLRTLKYFVLAAVLFALPPVRAQRASADLAAHVHADMDFLATDEMHGRGSLTRDEHLAALYCAAVFEGLGLKPAGDADAYTKGILAQRGIEF